MGTDSTHGLDQKNILEFVSHLINTLFYEDSFQQ